MMKSYSLVVLYVFLTITACQHVEKIDVDQYAADIKEHRDNYLRGFVEDPRSPIDSSDLQFISYFDVEPELRCKCELQKEREPLGFKMSTYAGTVQNYLTFGKAVCKTPKYDFTLDLYQSAKLLSMPMHRNRLFVPFRDLTNGETSYGGGRYLDIVLDSMSVEQIVIDFNKAYNPWCSYGDGYACPIPPVANHLDFAVLAGERDYTGPHKTKASARQ